MIVVNNIEDIRDLDQAFSIREKVFVEEQHVPVDAEYDEHEKVARHYLATLDGIPCGAARWRQTDKGIKLERFAVLSDFRNKEVGSHILKKVIADVKAEHPDQQVYLHAQLPAVKFYTRHGFEPVGEMFSECDIDHYKMMLHA